MEEELVVDLEVDCLEFKIVSCYSVQVFVFFICVISCYIIMSSSKWIWFLL